jgi:hypothetical protein
VSVHVLQSTLEVSPVLYSHVLHFAGQDVQVLPSLIEGLSVYPEEQVVHSKAFAVELKSQAAQPLPQLEHAPSLSLYPVLHVLQVILPSEEPRVQVLQFEIPHESQDTLFDSFGP